MMNSSNESFTSWSPFPLVASSSFSFSCTLGSSTQEQVPVSQVQPGKHWVAAAQPQVQVLSAQVRPCDRKLLIYSYAAPRFGLF